MSAVYQAVLVGEWEALGVFQHRTERSDTPTHPREPWRLPQGKQRQTEGGGEESGRLWHLSSEGRQVGRMTGILWRVFQAGAVWGDGQEAGSSQEGEGQGSDMCRDKQRGLLKAWCIIVYHH